MRPFPSACDLARRGAFDFFVHQMSEQLADLSDLEMASTRKQLKTQQNMFALKLETTRAAAKVSLKNQKRESEAAAEREMTKKLTQLAEGGGTALTEALAKNEELAAKIEELNIKVSTGDEMLRDTQRLVRQSEAAKSTAEQKCEVLAKDAVEVKSALQEALVEIEGLTSEKASHGEQVRGLVKSVGDAKAQLNDALASLGIAMDENQTLQQKVQQLVDAMQVVRAEAAAKGGGNPEDSIALTDLRAKYNDLSARHDERLGAQAKLAKEHDQLGREHEQLRAEHEQMRDKHDVACAERDEMKREAERLLQECEFVSSNYATSTAEAERAAKMREEACKKEVAEMAIRMRAEVEEAERRARERGSTPVSKSHADAMVERLTKENTALIRDNEELGAELRTSRERIERMGMVDAECQSLRDEVAALKAAAEDAELAAGAAGGENAVALIAVKKELAAVKKELATAKNELAEVTTVKDELATVKDELTTVKNELATANNELSATTAHLQTTQHEVAQLDLEKREAREAMRAALQELNITIDKNKTLAEQVKELAEASEKSKRQVDETQLELDRALQELNIVLDKNRTLAEQVKALVGAADVDRKKVLSVQSELERALRSLGITLDENMTLKERVEQLFNFARDLRMEHGKAMEHAEQEHAEAIKLLEEQLTEKTETLRRKSDEADRMSEHNRICHQELDHRGGVIKRVTGDLDHVKQEKERVVGELTAAHAALKAKLTLEVEKLEHELAQLRTDNEQRKIDLFSASSMLSDALGSVGMLSGEKQSLGEQVHALVNKYKSARSTIKFMHNELEQTLTVMEAALRAKDEVGAELQRISGEAEERIQRAEEGARQERHHLIRAALRSLDVLRGYIAASEQAARLGSEHVPGADLASMLAHTHQLGVPPATAGAVPSGPSSAIDGLNSGRRQWHPKKPEQSSVLHKSKHRWGVEPQVVLANIWEQTSQTAPMLRGGVRSLNSTPRVSLSSQTPRVVRRSDFPPQTAASAVVGATTPFAEAMQHAQTRRRRGDPSRLPTIDHPPVRDTDMPPLNAKPSTAW